MRFLNLCMCVLDVDVLQRLSLRVEQGSRTIPFGVISLRSGVILTPRARVTTATRSVLPPDAAWNATLVLSVRSHRVNSAFLFSVFSGTRIQLGLEISPGTLTLYSGLQNSVSFPYDLHDGRWHNLAIVLAGQTVTLLPACNHSDSRGASKELLLPPPARLDPRGTFRLGGSSALLPGVAPFEGAICQFDIVPTARAQANYCNAIRRQCRENDTYRPAPPPVLLPLQHHHTSSTSAPNLPSNRTFTTVPTSIPRTVRGQVQK
uniref:Thrombospondin-like N-terminal domain-containing protein n=1 Tax=Astyanax mexicanus TaxID=7994 RepID=A0A8B9LNV5_ASTMX